MSNVSISQLPLTTSVCPTALVPLVQDGVTCATYACLLGGGGGGGGGLTSVGLSMPSAFSVTNSPLTCNGIISVGAIGTNSQLISGCGGLISAGTGITISGGLISSNLVGSVSCIIQGTGMCISPSCGTGAVTICATGGGSSPIVSGSGTCSILGNGCGNNSTSAYHVTVGGQCNTSGNCALNSAIVGGFGNCSQSSFSFIGGGYNNKTNDGLGIFSYNAIVGGCTNSIYCSSGFIGGGKDNCINTSNSIIVGGCGNKIGLNTFGAGVFNTIVGGQFNKVEGNCHGGIFTGFCNCNNFTCAVFSAGDAGFAVTIGGCCNYNTSCFGLIGNGYNNCFQNTFGYNTNGSIINGNNNRICMAQLGVILSGNCNLIGNNCSAVINGSCNTLSAVHSTVFSGNNNLFQGAKCDNVFGFCNTLCLTNFANIFGCNNLIDTQLCGCENCYNFIQGSFNCIINIAPYYIAPCNAVIFGTCNMICTPTNGDIPNHIYAFGCGLVGTKPNTAYFNNICVCGTLSKVSGSFKIPHPDPIKAESGKFLKHSFVESPTAGDNIYRFNITTSNCSASIELPDYYNLLNGEDQVYVNAKKHLGYGFGVVNDEQTHINITTNTDGEYNVLLIGTRKDKLASDFWNGTEVDVVE